MALCDQNVSTVYGECSLDEHVNMVKSALIGKLHLKWLMNYEIFVKTDWLNWLIDQFALLIYWLNWVINWLTAKM